MGIEAIHHTDINKTRKTLSEYGLTPPRDIVTSVAMGKLL
jgi:hypothetical protein